MTRTSRIRTGACTKNDARNRLREAQAYSMVAELCISDKNDLATPKVAASLAVLAAIAAADAACCHRLGIRSRGQDHAQAADLLRSIEPGGLAMAKRFADVVAAKDDSHYGFDLISRAKAVRLVGKARELTSWAASVVIS